MMTLPKFVLGLVLVCLAVSIWSAIDGFDFVTILIRFIICAIVLQLGYFCWVFALVRRERQSSTVEESAAKTEEYLKQDSHNVQHH